jgi:hypothetical protein
VLEAAGVEFIDAEGGPEVRLRGAQDVWRPETCAFLDIKTSRGLCLDDENDTDA